MALLKDPSGETIILGADHTIGRSRSMRTTIREPEVSAHHAAIAWTSSGWTLRDLGSRNGTTHNGKAIETGQRVKLKAGDQMAFGEVHSFTLLSDSAPSAVARCGELVLEGDGELLALPNAEDPQAVVMQDPKEGWVLLVDDESRPVQDGEEVTVAGERWSLLLPESLDPTIEGRKMPWSLMDVSIDFMVSGDEEYVQMTVVLGSKRNTLKARAHHYVLLTLARERMRDAEEGVAQSEQGWVYTEDLSKMLRASSNQLYVSIHRARKELEGLEVIDAQAVVERRSTSRQVRLGVSRLTVGQL